MVRKPKPRRFSAATRETEEEWLERIRRRRLRMRVLVCLDGRAESFEGLRFAAELGRDPEVDIILLYVRPIDQGLRTGGLQVRVARENMLEWGLKLPGVQILQDGFEMLTSYPHMQRNWQTTFAHTDAFGDPLGDNKVVYRALGEDGKTFEKQIILKLKTAPDVVNGILDQYELGPYNLIIMGRPSRWRGDRSALWGAGKVQQVAILAPCSVLTARDWQNSDKNNDAGHLLCFDGTQTSARQLRQAAVLSHTFGQTITVLSIVRDERGRMRMEKRLATIANRLQQMGITDVNLKLEKGNSVRRIIEQAQHYSLLVTGVSDKSRLMRFFSGSVSFDVFGRATTSAMLVR